MPKKITEKVSQRTSNGAATQTPVVEGYGTTGQHIASELSKAVHIFNDRSGSAIIVAWHPSDKCFVLKNSSSVDKTSMQRVTESIKSDGWKPVLADKPNSQGNFIVQLKTVASSDREQIDIAFHYAMTRQTWGQQAVVGSAVQQALVAPPLRSLNLIGPTRNMNSTMLISPAIAMGVLQGETGFGNSEAAFINPGIARGVLQGEAGFTSADSQKHLIGSYGAGPCVIVALYHPASKRAALAHIDACVDAGQAIGILVYNLTANSDSKVLDVHFASGTLGQNNKTESELKLFLSYQTGPVIRSEHNTSSLAIDAKDGKVYEGVKFGQLDDGDEVDSRLETRYQVAIRAGQGPNENLITLFDEKGLHGLVI